MQGVPEIQQEGDNGVYLILDSAEGALEMGAITRSGGALLCAWAGARATSTVEDLEDGLAFIRRSLERHPRAKWDGSFCGIVVAQGPGSFTGLRIGYAFVAGLASAWGVPLIEIPSLDAYAAAVPEGWGIVITDARRGEFFTKRFSWNEGELTGDPAPVIRSPAAIVAALSEWSPSAPELSQRAQGHPHIIVLDGVLQQVNWAELFVAHWLPIAGDGVRPLRSRIGAIASFLGRLPSDDARRAPRPLAAIQPDYVRAVAAKTIVEREEERVQQNGREG